MYRFTAHKNVQKFLDMRDDAFLLLFRKKVGHMIENPFDTTLDIKPLSWKKGHYRLRIWKYRFLFEIKRDVVLIYMYEANTRWDIY